MRKTFIMIEVGFLHGAPAKPQPNCFWKTSREKTTESVQRGSVWGQRNGTTRSVMGDRHTGHCRTLSPHSCGAGWGGTEGRRVILKTKIFEFEANCVKWKNAAHNRTRADDWCVDWQRGKSSNCLLKCWGNNTPLWRCFVVRINFGPEKLCSVNYIVMQNKTILVLEALQNYKH